MAGRKKIDKGALTDKLYETELIKALKKARKGTAWLERPDDSLGRRR